MTTRATASRHATFRRLLRYGSVSAVSTVTSLLLLGVLVGLIGLSAVWANVIATAVGTIPSFELNRRWVWAHDGRRSLHRQALPYLALALAGLLISTLAVHVAADATAGASALVHTVAVELANVSAYGALWGIQFFLCDRVLFHSSKPQMTAAADDGTTPPHLVGPIRPEAEHGQELLRTGSSSGTVGSR